MGAGPHPSAPASAPAAPETCAREGPGSGVLLAVVGPSGAGKDSLIDAARRHFSADRRVHVVQRVITRAADAGGECHQPATDDQFDALKRTGAFAVDWEAHGLRYGIPSEVRTWLARGDIVLANGSRSVLPRFAAAFPKLVVVNVTARTDVLADRLAARGRESRAEILQRLARSTLEIRGDYDVVTIDNSGTLEAAGRRLIDTIDSLLDRPRRG